MTLTQTGAQADPTQCGTEVVLLVDDERAVRAVAGDMLRSFGYTVLEARWAEDAVQAATAHRGRIHLLLTDVALPRECGRALAAVMMACRPGLRILYMSGFSAAAV